MPSCSGLAPFPSKQETLQEAVVKKRKDPLEPKAYLPCKSHPEYQNRELNYFVEHYFGKKWLLKHRSFLGIIDPRVVASVYQKEIERAKVNSDEMDKYVSETVKLFGDHFLELTEDLNPLRFCEEAERLAAGVCRVLGHLRSTALKGTYAERKKAKARLEKILKAILPDTRGKKKKTVNLFVVQNCYWKELFRLYHIRNVLHGPGLNQSRKVKAASKNFEMPVKTIRELWGLDEEDKILRGSGPFTIKDMARELTARKFSNTLQTVSNILSSKS